MSRSILQVETDRLSLRAITHRDFDLWLDAYSACAKPVDQFDKGPLPAEKLNRDHFINRVRGMRTSARRDTTFIFGVFLKDNSRLIGSVDLGTYDRGNVQFANIGYEILNQHVGHGFGTEAVRAATEIGLTELGFHRIEASINLENYRSIRVITKAGYEYEGIRKQFWRRNDVWEDQMIYARIAA
jgi:[ribosomal protein S5]-alanine N-acetyltransferase